MKKYQIFTAVALILMTVFFTIPIICFYGTPNKIRTHKTEEITPLAHKVWDLYSPLQYFNNRTYPEEVRGSLAKMLEKHAEIGMASAPVWMVSLEAIQYQGEEFPEGIPVFFHFDGFSGEVHEMNTINHFIGMYPMERGGQFEMSLMPYFFLLLTLCMIIFLNWNSKKSWILMFVPAVLPVGFLGIYAGWLYWFGHNMQDWGAFKIKPFMPTVFGDGKVAQFTTHSYPTIGFYILLIISFFTILAIFSKLKYLKQTEQETK